MAIVAHPSTDWRLDSLEGLSDLPFRYLLMGDPDFVPAGKYAKQLLQSSIGSETGLPVWDSVEGRMGPTADLRRVLALVEADRSLIGMVYATDLAASPAVRVLYQVPPSAIEVNYYLVRLNSSQKTPGRTQNANRFLDYLFSEPSARIFKQFGFRVPAQ